MRFAVRRPGSPVASPRSHGVPRRDVPGRVHVRVAGETAGCACEARLALARLRIHMPARRAALAGERGSDLLHPAGAFSSSRRTSSPQPDRRMPRFSRALARTFRPEFSRVPFAERVMFVICRSSILIRSNRRAISVLAFSAQSLRRSVWRAFSRAIASLTRLRRFEPRWARASLRSRRSNLFRSRAVRPGACSNSPVDRAALTATPRSIPTTCAVAGRADRIGYCGEGDMPAPGPVHRHPVRLHPWRHCAGPAETHPAGLWHPDLADMAGHAAHVPLPPAPPHDPEPLIPPGLAPRRPPGRVGRIEERGHRLGEIPQRLLLHHLGALGQPVMLRPGWQ